MGALAAAPRLRSGQARQVIAPDVVFHLQPQPPASGHPVSTAPRKLRASPLFRSAPHPVLSLHSEPRCRASAGDCAAFGGRVSAHFEAFESLFVRTKNQHKTPTIQTTENINKNVSIKSPSTLGIDTTTGKIRKKRTKPNKKLIATFHLYILLYNDTWFNFTSCPAAQVSRATPAYTTSHASAISDSKQ